MEEKTKTITERFEEALKKWNALGSKAQLMIIITIFLWFWYLFMGRGDIEVWKVFLVNIILIYGISTAKKSGKKKDIVKKKNGWELSYKGKKYMCKSKEDAKELKNKLNK